ncbi:MAG: carbohydrate kinase family protein [Nanoarchaeota archaeon]|nr:carbohydrate kinase family protein [Nanoarchaeota archaeon]
MFDVVTVGSNVVDLFVTTELKEKGKYILVPSGDKLLINDFRVDIGGGGTNTAVGFSRLGLKTGYLGIIGNDGNGDRVLECLKKEKVHFLGKREGNNGVSVILDSKNHNRTVLTYKSVNDNVVNYPKFNTKWLYFSSMMGKSLETQIKLARELISKNLVKIAFNPSSYLIKKKIKSVKTLLKMSSILVLNKEESLMLAKNIEGLRKLGPRIVVVTNQNKSIEAYDGRIKYKLKPHKIKVIERTGAGDAFASGFTAGIIRELGMEKSLKLGLKNSESVLRHYGAKNNLLRWRDVSK